MKRATDPFDRRPRWEPEPLHIPATRPRRQTDRDSETEPDESRDLPGSHVIVIDLS